MQWLQEGHATKNICNVDLVPILRYHLINNVLLIQYEYVADKGLLAMLNVFEGYSATLNGDWSEVL